MEVNYSGIKYINILNFQTYTIYNLTRKNGLLYNSKQNPFHTKNILIDIKHIFILYYINNNFAK